MSKAIADTALMSAEQLPSAPGSDLSHLPGHKGLPLIGDALPFLKNTLQYMRTCHEKYGDVFWTHIGPTPALHLVDADAVKLLTLDSDKNERQGDPLMIEFFETHHG